MRRMRLVGLALVAVFALSVVVAAAAQAAEPEFLNAKGEAVVKTGFTSSSGAGTMYTKGAAEISCSSSSATGNIKGTKEVANVVVTFSGCTAKNLSNESTCSAKSEGQSEGTIVTEKLVGKLVKTSVGTKVGQVLKPASGSTYVKVIASCLALEDTTVKGEIVGEVSPLKEAAETGKLVYNVNAKKEQAINEYSYEGKEHTGAVLKAFGLIESSLSTSNTVKFEELVQVT